MRGCSQTERTMESIVTTVKGKKVEFKLETVYVSHFGRKVTLKSFDHSKENKPLVAIDNETLKPCYFHFNQLTESKE